MIEQGWVCLNDPVISCSHFLSGAWSYNCWISVERESINVLVNFSKGIGQTLTVYVDLRAFETALVIKDTSYCQYRTIFLSRLCLRGLDKLASECSPAVC